MDYDNDNSQLQTSSVVRQRSRGASTRHRHTSPATLHHEERSRSGDDSPASPHRRERDEEPEDLAGLRISHAFRGFTPDVIFDEPFSVPSKPFFRKVHNPIPVHSSPVISADDTLGSTAPSVLLAASERLDLLSCQPPNVMRSISDESTSSFQSAASATVVIDTGHNVFIPSIGTTNKFTHKWPIPKSVSYESQPKELKDVRLRPNQSPASALEDGQGLGSSRAAHWTVFKWCLLLSVTTLFAYGAAGLICALMTWFKSQSTSRS
jgi:hypothetical protein